MAGNDHKLTIRYMQVSDIPEVMTIDHASFKPPWPEHSYRFELNESQVSYMVVLEKTEQQPISGWKRLVNNLRDQDTLYESVPVIVDYGG